MQVLTYLVNETSREWQEHPYVWVFLVSFILMVGLYAYMRRVDNEYMVSCANQKTAVKIGNKFYYIVRSDEYLSSGLFKSTLRQFGYGGAEEHNDDDSQRRNPPALR